MFWRLRRAVGFALVVLLPAGCRAPDPKQQFEISDLETYWAVESPKGATVYIAPVLRFRLKNRGDAPVRSVEAQAGFRRVGALDQEWASGWAYVATSKSPLAAGATTLVEIKSEGRYSMHDTEPEDMLQNEGFQDAQATLYLRAGRSSWTLMGEPVLVERRIGARNAAVPEAPAAIKP
jgi:hypothetical protein